MSNERIQVGGDAAWFQIQLPDRLYYNNGRDEFVVIIEWIRNNVGIQAHDWNIGAIKNYIMFKNAQDLVAFKLRFGL